MSTKDKNLIGTEARHPTQIPARGWWQILRRAWDDSQNDNVSLMAAGVAFWLFLSLVPSMLALITVYGLVTDPTEAAEQVEQFAGALPEEARSMLNDQVTAITQTQSSSLTVGFATSMLAALWAASTGTMNLISATNIAYDEEEKRNFVQLRAIALATTVVVIIFVAVSIGLLTIVPFVMERLGLGVGATIASHLARWLGLIAMVTVGLALLYRYAPYRREAKVRWISVGATVATVAWLLASAAFSVYVGNFASYSRTYGAIAGVIVLMLWLYITSFIVLFGAEINAAAEHQMTHDTTKGPDRPMGQRNAHVADTYPDD